jgi:hypothetical protein
MGAPPGSDTVTVYGTRSPKLSIPPLAGTVIVTTGAVFPTVICTFAKDALPVLSVTLS